MIDRLACLMNQRYPPVLMVPLAFGSFLVVYFGLQASAGPGPLHLTWRAVAGGASVFWLGFLFRLYDEIKDVETDLALGRAGDPLYRHRPIVRKEIGPADLHRWLHVVVVLLVAINLPLGPGPLAAFSAVMAAGWLSSRWFFSDAVKNRLMLAFVTHNPIPLLIAAYAAAIHGADFGPAPVGPTVALMLVYWLPISCWETSRKIRAPQDETAYRTYSKELGWRTAPWLPVGFSTVLTGLLYGICRALRLDIFYFAVALPVWGLGLAACAGFRLQPTRFGAAVARSGALHMLMVDVGFPLAVALLRGVTWK